MRAPVVETAQSTTISEQQPTPPCLSVVLPAYNEETTAAGAGSFPELPPLLGQNLLLVAEKV